MKVNNTIKMKISESLKSVQTITNGNIKDFVENVTELAKDKSPVDTGHNKSTITWDEENGNFRVYTQSGYGGYLELGTSKQQAQPYIMPAYNQSKKEFLDELKGSI